MSAHNIKRSNPKFFTKLSAVFVGIFVKPQKGQQIFEKVVDASIARNTETRGEEETAKLNAEIEGSFDRIHFSGKKITMPAERPIPELKYQRSFFEGLRPPVLMVDKGDKPFAELDIIDPPINTVTPAAPKELKEMPVAGEIACGRAKPSQFAEMPVGYAVAGAVKKNLKIAPCPAPILWADNVPKKDGIIKYAECLEFVVVETPGQHERKKKPIVTVQIDTRPFSHYIRVTEIIVLKFA